MTDLRTAAQQALEALEMLAQPTKTNSETPRYKAHKAAITALRDALAQQTQTPCDIAEDGVCEVIDCCGKPPQRAQEEQPIRAHWMALPEAPKGGGNLPPPLAGRAGAASQREKVAHWMRSMGYATGHGDTIEDLLDHLGTQIAEGLNKGGYTHLPTGVQICGSKAAAAIRARSKE
jgi:hypothetical protein